MLTFLFSLPRQVLYVPANGEDAVYRSKPDLSIATPEERQQGEIRFNLTITANCRKGARSFQRTQSAAFSVRLDPEKVIRRVPAKLGNILGLTPKSMR
ncbi:MAG: hypothetical protein HYU36_04420 [Planctomycetes bacterium]|nr:hypothetical protein [Planctomycetota bacterium]